MLSLRPVPVWLCRWSHVADQPVLGRVDVPAIDPLYGSHGCDVAFVAMMSEL
jgi:hypothetical protein